MAQWGTTDDAANSAIWGVAGYKKRANTTNRDTFFGNTTADGYITGLTVGQFGVDKNEAAAVRQSGAARGAHMGWNVRKELSNGRVMFETIVAMSKNGMSTDASDDSTIPDYTIVILSQPSGDTANTSAGEDATFTVSAASVPSGATLVYAWKYANGVTIQAGANVGNTTQATLTVNSAVETANVSFKVQVSTTGGAANVTSANATLTITT